MVWSVLSECVLQQIMLQLDLHDRFTSAALVCTAWQQAAVAATQHLVITPPSATVTKLQGVLAWLHTPHQLTGLELHGGHGIPIAALPCPQLQYLALDSFKVQLTPRGTFPGLLHAATALTYLALLRVTVLGGSQQLTALSVLTDLQQLVLSELQEPSLQYAALPSSLLPHLLQITHLQIVCGLSDAALAHLGALTSLQHLQLERLGADTTPAALEPLSCLQHLTGLWLEGAHFTFEAYSNSPSSSASNSSSSSSRRPPASLTALRSLQLHACNGIEPEVLGPLTALESLQLKLTPVEGAAEGAASFLSLLSRLQHLTELELHAALPHAVTSPCSAYSALTASSKLQSLRLSALCMPAAAWQWVFPVGGLRGQQLAHLTHVRLSYCEPPLSADGLKGLARCAGVRSLALHAPLQHLHAVDASTALQQLSSLTELSISHVGDEWTSHVLAALTGLSALMIVQPSSVTDVGVLQLTALQQLSSLWVASEGLSKELCTSGTRGILQLVSLAFARIIHGAASMQYDTIEQAYRCDYRCLSSTRHALVIVCCSFMGMHRMH